MKCLGPRPEQFTSAWTCELPASESPELSTEEVSQPDPSLEELELQEVGLQKYAENYQANKTKNTLAKKPLHVNVMLINMGRCRF